MNQPITPSVGPPPEKPSSDVSRIIRRVHRYLGLFLMPWMFMYALSTAVMNHREWVLSFYADKAPAMVEERQLDYSRPFPPDATPQERESGSRRFGGWNLLVPAVDVGALA